MSLAHFLRANDAVLVTVSDAKGSTPRERGATMAVSRDRTHGTIGGGRLEYEAIERARAMLETGARPLDRTIMDRPLGPALDQCCGGRVQLLLRRAAERDAEAFGRRETEQRRCEPPVIVFGAGHVGTALATALAPLPLHVRVVDERREALDGLPSGVERVATPLPEAIVGEARPGACFVVLTHSHALDFEIARAALKRGDAAYVGMIGSATKAAKFRAYALREGMDRGMAERLACPMAPHARRDKRPEVIAAFVAAEVLGAALRAHGAAAVNDVPLLPARALPTSA